VNIDAKTALDREGNMYLENASDRPKMVAAAADPNARLPWPLGVIFCVYLFFIGTGLIRVVPLFSRYFDDLRVEIPWLTKMVLVSYWWTLALFSFLAIVLAVVRRAVSLTKIQRRATNAYLFLAAVVLPGTVVLALYLPMLKLMWKARSLG
jgi:type II secretory pathway component PulF